MDFLLYLVFWGFLSLIPGLIAKEKGHSFFGWWLLGMLFLPVAFVAALLIPATAPTAEALPPSAADGPVSGRLHTRACPYCAERIRREAIVCRYCGRDIERDNSPLGSMSPDDRDRLSDQQKLIVERNGYLLSKEDAETAWRMLKMSELADETATFLTERGTPVS